MNELVCRAERDHQGVGITMSCICTFLLPGPGLGSTSGSLESLGPITYEPHGPFQRPAVGGAWFAGFSPSRCRGRRSPGSAAVRPGHRATTVSWCSRQRHGTGRMRRRRGVCFSSSARRTPTDADGHRRGQRRQRAKMPRGETWSLSPTNPKTSARLCTTRDAEERQSRGARTPKALPSSARGPCLFSS